MKLKRKIEVCWRAGGTPAEISTQFGPDWLCEPGDKSYKPQFFFSISMKNGCLVTTVFNFVIKFAWTFFPITTFLGQLCGGHPGNHTRRLPDVYPGEHPGDHMKRLPEAHPGGHPGDHTQWLPDVYPGGHPGDHAERLPDVHPEGLPGDHTERFPELPSSRHSFV